MRIINLETSVTVSEDYWRNKAINYRMNPKNISALTIAGIDLCALANNHVLDFGYPGLTETLATLKQAGISYAGAGQNLEEAEAPALMELKDGRRVIVFSVCLANERHTLSWAARKDRPGINFLERLLG